MKKQLFTVAAIAVAAGVLTLASCKKDDTTAPTITITGGNTMTVTLPTTAGANVWTAPTVTATDDQDGDISTSVTASLPDPDVNTKGVYTVTYTVSDAAGNSASEVLTVNVVNSLDAAGFGGQYEVHDTVPTIPAFLYSMNISTDNAIDGRIHFNTGTDHSTLQTVSFADYSGNTGIYASISGATVTLPFQNTGAIGSNGHLHDFQGNGTVTATTPAVIFNITYTDHDQTNASTASGCVQTYTHQ
jgi:hypothetical protein